MIEFLPYLKDKSFLLKISTLILIIAVSLVLSMVLGIIIAIPIFGSGILQQLNDLNDFNNPFTIKVIKYFQVVNQVGIFILPVLFFAYLENRNIGAYLKIDRRPGFIPVLLSILMVIASIPAINWMVEVNRQMSLPDFLQGIESWMKETEERTNALSEAFLNINTVSALIINLVIIAFLASVGEEFLFRGVVLRLFNDWLKNSHLAIIISAVLFSALHLQFYGFLPRMILGILFGYVFIWTGTLWIPVILHFIFNGLTVVAAYLFNRGLISTDIESFGTTDDKFQIIGSCMVTVIFLLLIYLRKNKTVIYKNKKEETYI
ncbi:MAG: CPBP family intramembrane metalloprotease [Bacteroidetes bacterium]|nr:CPBP family intramembrane metalloprotease [Bacteroidota bacterium]MBL7105324.1 CPBP family intramembrane metalloprotease [Bacteroidales bacterium]